MKPFSPEYWEKFGKYVGYGNEPKVAPKFRQCSRKAKHGAYCFQHAKRLTGFYAPDSNNGADWGNCSELIRNR